MKLLERNQMHDARFTNSDTRFSQSFTDFPVRPKLLSTTRHSFASRPSRLPQLSRSFSSSSTKNTKKRISDMDEQVADLSKKVHDLKLQTRVPLM